jgi:predicted homoserine dehydrogenase-like protein
MVTSFADGSKISFEQSIVANATGFKVVSRGMSRGREYEGSMLDIDKLYDLDELRSLGEGPLQALWTPYHVVHFETPNSIARVLLFRDELAPPLGGPVVEVCAVAKRDLNAGEVLDDYGMYMTYGEA